MLFYAIDFRKKMVFISENNQREKNNKKIKK